MRNDLACAIIGRAGACAAAVDRVMTRLLFVDDHPLYRAGFELALARAMPSLEVAVAASAEDALDSLADDADFDLCLADVRLPGRSGFELLETVGARWPTVARALLCSEPTPELVARARAMGLLACLSKARDMDMLTEALGCLFAGNVVFDADSQAPGAMLSAKRRRVLELGSHGQSNKQIARVLGIGERTVKDHWTAIFDALGVANRVEAVSKAHLRRLI